MPELDLKGLDGSIFRLTYGDTALDTVVYVLSPTCVWCDRNERSIDTLSTLLHGRARVVGVALGRELQQTADYVSSAKSSFPIYTGLSDTDAKAMRLRSTPTTYVVSPTGTLLAIWEGAFAGATREAIQKHFDVKLPEIKLAETSVAP